MKANQTAQRVCDEHHTRPFCCSGNERTWTWLAEGGSIVIIRTLHSCHSFRFSCFFVFFQFSDKWSLIKPFMYIFHCKWWECEECPCEAEIHSYNKTTQYYGTIIICTARGDKLKFGANKPDSNQVFLNFHKLPLDPADSMHLQHQPSWKLWE